MKSVSCVIPVYNLNSPKNWDRFCFLIRSLVLAAKDFIPDNFEILIINDDPECNMTSGIISLFSDTGLNKCARILPNLQNRGQAFSRNRGGNAAANDYLHFIDQDDFINPEFYSALIEEKEKDVYIANPSFYLENSHKEIIASSFITRMMYQRSLNLKQLWLLLLSNIVYSPGQVIIKRMKFAECGGFPVLKNFGSDDYGLFYNLAMNSDATVSYMKSAIFYYRIHGDQSSKKLNMDNSIKEFFETVKITEFKGKIIKNIKIGPIWRPVAKFAYLVFFKRAPRKK